MSFSLTMKTTETNPSSSVSPARSPPTRRPSFASLLVKQGHDVSVVMTRGRDRVHHPADACRRSRRIRSRPASTTKSKTGIRATSRSPIARTFSLIAPATRAHHRGAGARTRAVIRWPRSRLATARAGSARAGDERKDVGASSDARKTSRRSDRARRRVHRSGSRHAGVRLRRPRALCGKWMRSLSAPSSSLARQENLIA